jgi:hypothetical protein
MFNYSDLLNCEPNKLACERTRLSANRSAVRIGVYPSGESESS